MTLKEFLHKHYFAADEDNPNIGCLITFKNKKQYLIGHINSVGGRCDDCMDDRINEEIEKIEQIWKTK